MTPPKREASRDILLYLPATLIEPQVVSIFINLTSKLTTKNCISLPRHASNLFHRILSE